ncbi:unnamed protein product [Sphagnum jensenii]|uniref:Uncharacterized protein n=1 Tax=Sphagnum jensenii TaxID=128206 RepID=A0ABP0VA54_9BRYO
MAAMAAMAASVELIFKLRSLAAYQSGRLPVYPVHHPELAVLRFEYGLQTGLLTVKSLGYHRQSTGFICYEYLVVPDI